MKVWFPMVLSILSFLPSVLAGEPLKTGWGEIRVPEKPELAERRELVVEKWPEDGNLVMPVPFPNIVRVWVERNEAPEFLRWSFNKDATENRVMGGGAKGAGVVQLLTAEKSGIKGCGTCVLSALDAKVLGVKAALETHPGNHRIGFWVDGADFVAWDLEAPVAAGKYDVELVYSRAGQAGAEVAVTIGDVVLPVVLETTGSWYVYQVQAVGEIVLGAAGKLHAEVRSTKLIGPVMNLKAVLLLPKGE